MIDTENPGSSCISEIVNEKEIKNHADNNIPSITLDEIFQKYKIKRCKLLKIDCEGSEYEILYNANADVLSKCENLRAEFHESKITKQKFGTADSLLSFVKQYIKNIKITKVNLD